MKTETDLYRDMEGAKRKYHISKKLYNFHNRDMKGNYKGCFWTHPWGHIWGPHPRVFSWYEMCIFCNKKIDRYD